VILAFCIDQADFTGQDGFVGLGTSGFALLLASVWSTDGGISSIIAPKMNRSPASKRALTRKQVGTRA
jgi:hypothetical protein